ncbi:HNH endonuclease family protein [Brevibacterium sp. FME37]|uniref:HNH endonuclease family protein n=1 Tax=Brevibacterium sp. FME37 TaxID=2742607 RepID=UPI0018673D21|nr:HNH endonuclease family protein [Brevibacterium sp. FME37]
MAVIVLALLSGCAGGSTGQVVGGEVAWSTGGGGAAADSDPVPSRPAASAAPAPGHRPHGGDSEVPASSGPDVSAQNEAKPTAGDEDNSDSPRQSAGTAEMGAARSMLDKLEVKGKDHRTGYDPQLFDWSADVDGNGCDTRNDALRRDLRSLQIEAGTKGCVATAGDLEDKYLGKAYGFERGSTNVDIDYIVSGSNAWQTGAAAMSTEQLREFGNDPLNLLTVSADLIRQKGGGDAAAWLPPNESFQCEYVSRQIAVKHKYGLWVAAAEKGAMEAVLDTCADQPAFTSEVSWPKPGESVKAEPTAEESTQQSSPQPSGAPSGTDSTERSANPADDDADASTRDRTAGAG